MTRNCEDCGGRRAPDCDHDPFEDALYAHPSKRNSTEALRLAEREGLPLKFSDLIPENKLFAIYPSRMFTKVGQSLLHSLEAERRGQGKLW